MPVDPAKTLRDLRFTDTLVSDLSPLAGIETLEEIVDYHLAGGQPPTIGLLSPLLQPRVVSTSERDALLAFLRSLDVESPPPPWNDWPER